MKRVLFVCTGNTCRSPMAQCLFSQMAKQQGVEAYADSAGLYAREGEPASDGAYAAMETLGCSLQWHRAKPVTEELLAGADVVLCMTQAHAEQLQMRFPDAKANVRAFNPPIPDPYGGSAARYLETAAALKSQLQTLILKWKGSNA